jgi:hypothetical protein
VARVPQVVGRLFSAKLALDVEGMVQPLGKIWCPSLGIRINVIPRSEKVEPKPL